MNKLSIGVDSTLGEYLKIAKLLFGENSHAVTYLENKIKESPNGETEEVVADESQVLHLLAVLAVQDYEHK